MLGSSDGAGREAISRDRILRAAFEIADESGIGALTMRELGRRLGIEAASLYNHVRNKDELLDAMTDRVVAEIERPSPEADWREAMERRAVSARQAFKRHPWAAGLIDTRGLNGPNGAAYVEAVLGCLLDAGFAPAVAGSAFVALDSYIYGFERQRSALGMGGHDEAAAMARDALAAVPSDAYPSLTRVASAYAAHPADDAETFSFGLGLLLDGMERLRRRQ